MSNSTIPEWIGATVEAVPFGIAITRPDGSPLYTNARVATLLGGGGAWETFWDDPSVQAIVRDAIGREDGVRDVALRTRRADGAAIDVLLSVQRIQYDGEPAAVLTTLYDATAQRRVEHELRDAERLARSLLNSTGEGIYASDLHGKCLWANPAAVRLCGYTSDTELLGRVTHEMVHHTRPNGDPYPLDECKIYLAIREHRGTVIDDELMFRKDGTSFPCEYRSFPVDNEKGELVGCVVTFTDITVRKRNERLLAEQQAELGQVARFFEMNPGPVLRTDLRGSVLIANAVARQVFGSALVGQNWCETCPGIDAPTWQRMLDSSEAVRIEAQVGAERFVFAHRRDTSDEMMFVFGSNVTGQRRAERQMRQAEKMATLGTLAAGVAHELNNPAAAVQRAAEQLADAVSRLGTTRLALATLGDAERAVLEVLDAASREKGSGSATPAGDDPLARADRVDAVERWLGARAVPEPWELAPGLVDAGFDPAALTALAAGVDPRTLPALLAWAGCAFPVHALAREIGTGASRIAGIVGALKSYAALDQAPVRWVQLSEGLEDTLAMLRQKIADGVTVTREYDPALPHVLVNGGELNLVWTSLITNAIEALDGHGTIALRTSCVERHAVVEVADNGPGIPADVLPRVFDPFFSTKAPGKGTGLGLSMSYSIIVEKHNGHMQVDSRPGRTRVTVALPLEPGDATVEGWHARRFD